MSIGFQAFIEGTSYDVLNSMDYNFVVDVVNISGSGSKSYSYPGFTLSAFVIGGTTQVGGSTTGTIVSVSGSSVSWRLGNSGTIKMVVVATAVSTASYFGFTLNDYSTNPPKFKIAPNFTPFSLTQVIDITPSFGQIYQTKIPSSEPMIAFHRSRTATGFDHVIWTEISQNGYWSLRFREQAVGTPMAATRIYIFSKHLVNPPANGFYLYDGNKMVWHSNCLPLSVSTVGITNSSVPVAITSGVSVIMFIPSDPATPTIGTIRYNCFSAGKQSDGLWDASTSDVFWSVSGSKQDPIAIGPPAVIRTNIYDAYFSQSIG